MGTTTEMWAVFDRKNKVIEDTLSTSKDNSKHRASVYRGYHWLELEDIGYTCRRVKVTIVELPKGEK